MNKKIKILLVVLMMFLISGCQADYNLTITDNYIKESTFLYSNDEDEYNKTLYRGYNLKTNFKALSNFKQSAFVSENMAIDPNEHNDNDNGTPLYNNSYTDINKTVGTTLEYTYNLDEYQDSYIANTQSHDFTYTNNDDEITISLGDTYAFTSYKLLDTINVKITIDGKYEVISDDAEIINDNEYMWTITRENYIDRQLSINLKKIVETPDDDPIIDDEDKEEDNGDNNKEPTKLVKKGVSTLTLIIVASGILLIIGFGLILLEKKANKDRI